MKAVQLVRLHSGIEETLTKDPAYFDAMARGDWAQVASHVHRLLGATLSMAPGG